MSSVIIDCVVWQVGGHQQGVYVFGPEAFHISLGKVGVQVTCQIVVTRGELKTRCQVAYALVRS